jgi:hypothetical protein
MVIIQIGNIDILYCITPPKLNGDHPVGNNDYLCCITPHLPLKHRNWDFFKENLGLIHLRRFFLYVVRTINKSLNSFSKDEIPKGIFHPLEFNRLNNV